MTESAHAKAIMGREPFSMTLDVTGCYGHTGEPLPKVLVKILSKKEEMAAIVAAHVGAARLSKQIQELSPDDRQRFAADHDVLADLKCTEALHLAIRDADDPSQPAFPSAEWMKEWLDTDSLGALLNLYLQVRAKRGPSPEPITDEWIETIRNACAMAPEELPELPVTGWSREYLASFLSEAMRAWYRERADLQAKIEALTTAEVAVDNQQ